MINRVILIILDSLGVGFLPDANRFNDHGANTLLHIYQQYETLNLVELCSLGMGKIVDVGCKTDSVSGCFGKMAENKLDW